MHYCFTAKSTLLVGLIHVPNQLVYVVLAIAKVAAFNEVLELPRSKSPVRIAKLERPQKVANLLEIGSNSINLVANILNTDDSVLTKLLLDHLVICKWDSLLVDLAVSSLQDQLANRLEIRVPLDSINTKLCPTGNNAPSKTHHMQCATRRS